MDAEQDWTREPLRELGTQHLTCGLQRDRSDREPLEPIGLKGSPQAERRRLELLRSGGHDETDGDIVQSPNDELEHAGRGGVQPLRVVDRHHGRCGGGESQQGSVEGSRDSPLVRRGRDRLGAQEGDRDR